MYLINPPLLVHPIFLLLYFKQSSNLPCPEPNQSTEHFAHSIYIISILIIASHFGLGIPHNLFSILLHPEQHPPPTCPTPLILLYFIIVIKLVRSYKFWNSPLRNFLWVHPPYFLLDPNILAFCSGIRWPIVRQTFSRMWFSRTSLSTTRRIVSEHSYLIHEAQFHGSVYTACLKCVQFLLQL